MRRSPGPGRAFCRSHNVASSLKILAKNQPGQVKMGCQAQTIDIDRCSCNHNPSNGPTNEVGTHCLLVIGPQRGYLRSPCAVCSSSHRPKTAKNTSGRVKTDHQSQPRAIASRSAYLQPLQCAPNEVGTLHEGCGCVVIPP